MKYTSKTFLICLCFIVIGINLTALCAEQGILDQLAEESNLRDELQQQAMQYRQEGLRAQQAGKLNEAVSLYQKAIGIDPSFAAAYNDLGIVFESKGQIERAKGMYLSAAGADPQYPNTYSNLALLFEGQGDYSNAILYWVKRAMVGEVGDPWTEVALKRLEQLNRLYPESFDKADKSYSEGLQTMGIYPGMDYQNPAKVTLFDPKAKKGVDILKSDPKVEALRYVQMSKESLAAGEYATALKEITVAEYLDPSNPDIKALANRIRESLLR
jgi:tetratricopeptide (TPR) repeat protein